MHDTITVVLLIIWRLLLITEFIMFPMKEKILKKSGIELWMSAALWGLCKTCMKILCNRVSYCETMDVIPILGAQCIGRHKICRSK